MVSGEETLDPGLQPERTLLAWQRTALAFVVAIALVIRVGASSGPVVLVLGFGGLVLALLTALWTRLRYRAVRAALAHRGDVRPDAGSVVMLMSLTTALVGVACLGFVIAQVAW